MPGWVMTERQRQLWVTPEALERHRHRPCLPDPIEPVYIARIVLFLASDDAAMCTANNGMVEAGSIGARPHTPGLHGLTAGGEPLVVRGEPERRDPDRLVWTLDPRPA